MHDNVGQAVTVEWPEMAHLEASLKATPPALAEALQLVVILAPQGRAQETTQREILAALQQALDARRQRIIVSLASVNAVK